MKTYWHFSRIVNGVPTMRDGTPIEIGKKYTVDCAQLCDSGFHGSERIIDAMKYAPGPYLTKRIITGDIQRGEDKVCGLSCVHTVGIDATEILREFARKCALDVIHLWDALPVVIEFLKTGDEWLLEEAKATAKAEAEAMARAEAEAAWGVGWDVAEAARAAEWAAAWVAAWTAARKKQNARLTRMINKALKEKQ